ncbi:hypothetical protein, partial [Alteromonas sp. BZK5]|uniref:hypothetical protein n=1 Tax=Alteromonas sp. BZK5 TaxID=1904459 RepID=UPI001653B422
MFNFFKKMNSEVKSDKSKPTDNQILSSADFINSFNREYIDDKTIIQKFPAELDEKIESYLAEFFQGASERRDCTLLLTCLKEIYISLWLIKNGYAEVIASKADELCYRDEYG